MLDQVDTFADGVAVKMVAWGLVNGIPNLVRALIKFS